MGKNNNYSGLLLTFYKRKIISKKKDLKHYDYELLGYYDGLSVRPVEDWSGFSPYLTNMDGEQVSEFAGKYTVKLLAEDGTDRKPFILQKEYSLKKELPLFAILMLNVSWHFVHTCRSEEARRDILQQVIDTEIRDRKDTAVCGLFRSVGYYDYVILYRGTAWTPMYRMIDEMRHLTSGGDAAVSNTYFIPGLLSTDSASDADNLCGRITDNTEYNIAVHLNLQEKHSCMESAEKIRDDISGIFPEVEGKEPWEIYQQSGSSDCVIAFKSFSEGGPGLGLFLRQYVADGYFVPGHKKKNIFQDLVKGIRTSIGKPVSRNSETHLQNPKKSGHKSPSVYALRKMNEETVENIRNAIRTYGKYAEGHDLHTRQITYYNQMISLYENLTYSTHTFDICALMCPVWNILADNIRMSLDSIQNGTHGEEDTVEIDEMISALDIFRGVVGPFLQSLSYSDRSFIERIRLSGTAIGSGTMILFAYNGALCQILKIYHDADRKNDKETGFAMLVTSGGSDYTETFNLSEYTPMIRQGKIVEKRILVTRLSERSLYYPAGTMLRLVHELYHYRGDRQRILRGKKARKAFSAMISSILLLAAFVPERLLGEVARYSPELQKLKEDGKGEVLNESLAPYADSFLQDLRKKFTNEIDKAIAEIQDAGLRGTGIQSLDEEIAYYGEEYFSYMTFYASSLFIKMAEKLSVILADKKSDAEKDEEEKESQKQDEYEKVTGERAEYLVGTLHNTLGTAVSRFRQGLPEEIKKHVPVTLPKLIEEIKKLEEEDRKRMDAHSVNLNPQVLDLLERALRALSLFGAEELPEYWESDVREDKESPERVLLSIAAEYNCRALIMDAIMSALDESFSDYMACRCLHPSFNFYISTFLYEDRDLDRTLPLSLCQILRTGLVIERYFLENSMEFLTEKSIDIYVSDEKFSLVKGDGAGRLSDPDNTYKKEVQERIRILWKNYLYLRDRGVTGYLVEYLNQISYQELDQEESIMKIRRIYKSAESGDQRRFLDGMMDLWADLAETVGEWNNSEIRNSKEQ